MNVTLASRADVLAAFDRATHVALAAYVLAPHGTIVRALERAADRGADVTVTLAGPATAPSGGVSAAAPAASGPAEPAGAGSATAPAAAGFDRNAAVAADLRRHGVTVREAGPDAPLVHLKAAVADGRAFLDDRNWPDRGGETVVALDDPRAVAAVADTIRSGAAADAGALALDKRGAVALEAATIAAAPGDRIDVATETFGACAVSAALAARARSGTRVRLAVTARDLAGDRSGREHAALRRLAAAGVEVRATADDQKYAVAGDGAWVGSANATFAPGPMLDWGVQTRDPATLAALHGAFDRAWAAGTPVRA